MGGRERERDVHHGEEIACKRHRQQTLNNQMNEPTKEKLYVNI